MREAGVGLLYAVVAAVFTVPQLALASGEATARYFDSIRTDPPALRSFLQAFPKGADLHNHLDGAIYAETYLAWSAEDGLCADLSALALRPPPCSTQTNAPPVADIIDDIPAVNQLIDALSVRNYERRNVSGHDQFFSTFGRFHAATQGREADMVAAVTHGAAIENVGYLELMQTFGMEDAIALGSETPAIADIAAIEGFLDDPAFQRLVEKTMAKTDQVEAKVSELVDCSEAPPSSVCDVQVRYLATVLRSFGRPEVAAQAALAFELVKRHPLYVGLNFAMPEDMPEVLANYRWQMKLIRHLRQLFPSVSDRVTLHAGELTLGLVPPHELRFHVTGAVNIAGANRVGHATSIAFEDDTEKLLKKMARKGILVEVNLTSNRIILEVSGDDHPFQLLRRSNVPVALSTDDAGVQRTDLTREYEVAVQSYRISYEELKELSRNSLAYSFLPGRSLFTVGADRAVAKECSGQGPGVATASGACRTLLGQNPKAKAQWELERRFIQFEDAFQLARH